MDMMSVESQTKTNLEFPSGIEFLQALHGFLSVHHGGYSGALLEKEKDKNDYNIIC